MSLKLVEIGKEGVVALCFGSEDQHAAAALQVLPSPEIVEQLAQETFI